MDNLKFQELVIEQFSKLNDRFGNLEDRFGNLENEVQEIKVNQSKLETRIETEVIDKISGLFDARGLQNDLNDRMITSLERIEAKLDVLQLEAAHLRRIK